MRSTAGSGCELPSSRPWSLGCWDGEALRYLLQEDRLERAEPEAIEVGLLDRFERPLPPIGEYDHLLAAEVHP